MYKYCLHDVAGGECFSTHKPMQDHNKPNPDPNPAAAVPCPNPAAAVPCPNPSLIRALAQAQDEEQLPCKRARPDPCSPPCVLAELPLSSLAGMGDPEEQEHQLFSTSAEADCHLGADLYPDPTCVVAEPEHEDVAPVDSANWRDGLCYSFETGSLEYMQDEEPILPSLPSPPAPAVSQDPKQERLPTAVGVGEALPMLTIPVDDQTFMVMELPEVLPTTAAAVGVGEALPSSMPVPADDHTSMPIEFPEVLPTTAAVGVGEALPSATMRTVPTYDHTSWAWAGKEQLLQG